MLKFLEYLNTLAYGQLCFLEVGFASTFFAFWIHMGFDHLMLLRSFLCYKLFIDIFSDDAVVGDSFLRL